MEEQIAAPMDEAVISETVEAELAALDTTAIQPMKKSTLHSMDQVANLC